MTRLIVAALSMQIAFGSFAQATTNAPKPETKPAIAYRAALLNLRDMVAKNPEAYLDPTETRSDLALVDKVTMMEANQKLLSVVKDDSYTLTEIRKELMRRLNEEETAQRLEVRQLLLRMSDAEVEALAEKAFSQGRYSASLKTEYDSAYLQNEKREVLFSLLSADLASAKSDALKRLGLMDRKSLEKELTGTKALMNTKGDGWKVALIIVLSVAAAGLVSFGVISATKKRHERKSKELEEEYERKTDEAIKDHEAQIEDMKKKHQTDMDNTNALWAQKTEELKKLFADRAAMRDGGYTWQVCKTENVAKTVTCPYDKKTYVGTETCATYCLKNPQGIEWGGTARQLICSSAQIPWECFKPNAYDTGYGAGGTKGYNDGYDVGYNQAYTAAYDKAYQDFYELAYDNGYSHGYQDGFDDGYADGLVDGKYDGYQDGYDDGYPDGYSVGYAYGQEVAAGG
jgi:hypothetical protein